MRSRADKSEVGLHKFELNTPALLVDLSSLEKNLNSMSAFFADREVNLRPHVKTYNATPVLAQMQLEAGAIGVTCAKLSEAEILADSGITDILIANQIVGRRKIEQLAQLAKTTDIMVAVDSKENVAELSDIADDSGVTIRVLVEVNIGHNRCGVSPYEPAQELSRVVMESPGLKYMGLMGYDGHCTLKVDESEREALSRKANELLADTRFFIENSGIEVPIVSAGGTFTYRFAAEIDGITEIQAGTYLLMDTAFKEHGVHEFDPALSVLSTVISRPSYPSEIDLAIIDTGRKSISPILGMPEVKHPSGANLFSLSQEHGRVSLASDGARLKVGDKIELWVRDANGTVNQFDKFYAVRNDIVEDIWFIPGCGDHT
ncbi:MAG: DSD1 family PLP-dependent enzyme [Anaerolineales bacterium]